MNTSKLYSIFAKKIEEKIPESYTGDLSEDTISDEIKFRVIITFENITDRAIFITKNKDLDIINQFDIIPSINVSLSLKEINKYQDNELVKRIEEDQQIHLCLKDVIEITKLKKYKISQVNYTGEGINIGLIDIGIQTYYESFFESIIEEFEKKVKISTIKKERFVNKRRDITHATLMASIICNKIKDENNIRLGIAPDANIIDLPISNEQDIFYFSSILNILDDIIKGDLDMDILIISFSTLEPSDGKDALSKACEVLIENGIIVIVPVGNNGPFPSSVGSPGAQEQVITVGSIEKDGTISSFSGRGPTLGGVSKPDIYFPGSKIEVPILKDRTIKLSGTSVSTAIAAGLIALIKQYNSAYSTEEIKSIFDTYYSKHKRKIRIIDTVALFQQLGMYSRHLTPYSYLITRSLSVSIQIMIILIVIFYWERIFNFIRKLYGF
jgi:serine protease AprX